MVLMVCPSSQLLSSIPGPHSSSSNIQRLSSCLQESQHMHKARHKAHIHVATLLTYLHIHVGRTFQQKGKQNFLEHTRQQSSSPGTQRQSQNQKDTSLTRDPWERPMSSIQIKFTYLQVLINLGHLQKDIQTAQRPTYKRIFQKPSTKGYPNKTKPK